MHSLFAPTLGDVDTGPVIEPIATTGTARIRHRATGEIYELEADDVEWEAVSRVSGRCGRKLNMSL